MSDGGRAPLPAAAICDALLGARVGRYELDPIGRRVELAFTSGTHADDTPTSHLTMRGTSSLRWTEARDDGAPQVRAIGVEQLQQGGEWRIYLALGSGGEVDVDGERLELDGDPAAVMGRAYRYLR